MFIPNSVKTIDDYAFSGCSSIENVYIGNSVSSIKKNTFLNCSAITNLHLVDGDIELYIDEEALKESPIHYLYLGRNIDIWPTSNITLNKLTIGTSVTSCPDFGKCTSLKEIIILDGENPLYISYFDKNSIERVRIGRNLQYSESSKKSPFSNSTTLTEAWITDAPTSVSNYLFRGCTNLTNLYIGDNVKNIGQAAFSGCSGLKVFQFGDNLERIGSEALIDCTNITDIYAKPAVPPSCGSQALDDLNRWTCTLHVPAAYDAAYKSANQWKEFFLMDNNFDIELNRKKIEGKTGYSYQL